MDACLEPCPGTDDVAFSTPGRSSSSSSANERVPAPSETTAARSSVSRGRLEHHLAADREAQAADAARVHVAAALQERDGGLDVLVAAPAAWFGSPSLSPSPRRSKSSTP